MVIPLRDLKTLLANILASSKRRDRVCLVLPSDCTWNSLRLFWREFWQLSRELSLKSSLSPVFICSTPTVSRFLVHLAQEVAEKLPFITATAASRVCHWRVARGDEKNIDYGCGHDYRRGRRSDGSDGGTK
jgi:hypothetical protein